MRRKQDKGKKGEVGEWKEEKRGDMRLTGGSGRGGPTSTCFPLTRVVMEHNALALSSPPPGSTQMTALQSDLISGRESREKEISQFSFYLLVSCDILDVRDERRKSQR